MLINQTFCPINVMKLSHKMGHGSAIKCFFKAPVFDCISKHDQTSIICDILRLSLTIVNKLKTGNISRAEIAN